MDLRLEVVNNEMVIDWYHKETFSGRLLSFYSNHPQCHKIGTIYNLIDRAILLSHPKHHMKNIESCIGYLLNNGYPLKLIFDQINKRLKTIFINKVPSNINNGIMPVKVADKSSENKRQFFVIPYVKNISEITASIFDRSAFTVGFRSLNRLDNIIRVQKDRTEHTMKNNIVYKINCNNCAASYVGQTKRQMKTRIREHCNVISEHILNFKHNFNWDNVKILDREPNWHKRLISEMLHIKEQKNGINLQRDTELLNESYFGLLDDLSNCIK